MALKYSDEEIAQLIQERKLLSAEFRSKIKWRDKKGHKEQELDVIGVNNNQFRLILWQSSINPLDFSIILAYCPPKSNQLFRLNDIVEKVTNTQTLLNPMSYIIFIFTLQLSVIRN